MDELSSIELTRQRNIARNDAFLQRLGLDTLGSNASPCSTRSPRRSPRSKRTLDLRDENGTGARNRSRAAAAPLPEAAAHHHHEQQRLRSSSASEPQEQQHIRSSSASGAAEHQAQLENSFAVGQTVWARNPQQYGMRWWPATVASPSPLVVEWVDSSQDKFFSPLSFQDVRLRVLCRCGKCTATVLEDDSAFDMHKRIVTACINNANLQEIQSVANRWVVRTASPFPPPSPSLSPSPSL
jgi:hypothetical protein